MLGFTGASEADIVVNKSGVKEGTGYRVASWPVCGIRISVCGCGLSDGRKANSRIVVFPDPSPDNHQDNHDIHKKANDHRSESKLW